MDKFFEAAIENANEAICIIDNSHDAIVYVNKAACKMLEYSREALLQWETYESDSVISQEAIDELKKTKALTPSFETIGRTKSGHHILLEITLSIFEYGDTTYKTAILKDISYHKQIVSRLRQQEALYRTLAENSKDAIIRYDLECHRIYLNPGACRFFGKEAGALLGKKPSDASILIDAEAFEAILQKVIATKKPVAVDGPYQKPDGQMGWGMQDVLPEFNANAEVVSVLTIGRDLSDLKSKEQALIENERLFRTLVEKSPDTIARYNRDAICIYANEALTKALGLHADELLGKPPSFGVNTLEMMEFELRLLETMQEDHETEVEISWPDREDVWHTSLIRIVPEKDADGTIVSAFTTGRDITRLKETEQRLVENENRLKEAQRIAKIGSWELDHASGMIHLSQEACKILRISTCDNILLRSYIKRVSPKDRSALAAAMNLAVTEHKTFRSIHAIEGPEGLQYISLLGETLHNANDVPWLTRGTIQDVSDKKRAEQKIKKQEEQLVMQSRLAQMGEMLSMIAHQWRQPLGAIGSTVMTLQTKLQSGELTYHYTHDEGDEKYLHDRLDRIDNYVRHLATTIEDFRSFFKPNRDKTDFNLSEAMEKAIYLLSGNLESNRIVLRRNYQVDGRIESYKNEMIQVFVSLLNNAIEALSERQIAMPEIVIELEQVENLYILSIGDNAGGIDEAVIDRVFDPYFSTKANTGTGLGLYMAKIIIETHCMGNMLVQNTDDGATFSMIIPVSLD